jgi:hypothetical protein
MPLSRPPTRQKRVEQMDDNGEAEQRAADRVERGEAAHRRAEQAGVRAAELRARLDAAQHGDPPPGSTAEEVSRSREHAENADESMVRAFDRGASAHDRAAGLHERRAEEDGTPETSAGHARHAQDHRDAAAADRELARKARERTEPPAG